VSAPKVPAAGATNAITPVSAANPKPGIVRLERAGRRLGFGVVLRSDGRILTALSALGHGNFVRARFFDDHVLAVRVVASDRAWDLALLAPEGGYWAEGLRASSVDPTAEGVRLRRFGGRSREIAEAAVSIKARQVLLGRDGALLEDALVLGGAFAEDELGSPLCDETGEVLALVGQACDPAQRQDCRLASFGVPVSAIKRFLRDAPARDPLPAAWLGFRGVSEHSGSVAGVRVIAVDPGSPAEQAGLRVDGARGKAPGEAAGDLVVAVADAPVTTPEELRDAINRVAASGTVRAPSGGEPVVRLLVYGAGRFREVSLPLRAPVQLPVIKPAVIKPAASPP
jgi:S1-C subfamily serine protease